MPWFKVDDNLGFHHKVIAAGNAAMGLWVRAGAVSANQLTDGFVPDRMVSALGNKGQAERLVAVGLWLRTDGGYLFHEWSERQPSRESVEAEREAARKRMAERRRDRKGGFAGSSAEQTANFRRSSGDVRPPGVRPPRPDPTRPVVSDGADEPPAADEPTPQTLVAEWLDHCDERPPSDIIGQVSSRLKRLLADDIAPDVIRRGLAEWDRKSLHPSALPSVVHEAQKAKTAKQPARLPHVDELERPPDGLTDEQYAAWDLEQRERRRRA